MCVRFLLFYFLSFVCYTSGSAQIVNIEDRRNSKDTLGWFGQIDLGGNLSRNANEVLTLQGALRVDYFRKKSHLFFISDYRMVQANGANFLNASFGHFRISRRLAARLEWEAFSQLQYDEQLRLNLRFLLGCGPRLQLSKGDAFNAFLGVLYMYEHDELQQGESSFYDHRLSNYLSLSWILNKQITLSTISYYQPRLWAFDQSRLSSISNLRFTITRRLQFQTALNLTYDARINAVFPEVPKVTYLWKNGLRFSF